MRGEAAEMPSSTFPLAIKRALGATSMTGLISETMKLLTRSGSKFSAVWMAWIRVEGLADQVMLPVVKNAAPSQTVRVKVPPLTVVLKVSVSTSLSPTAPGVGVVAGTGGVLTG